MGVRGLTTFIAKQANKYLENYELHDSYVVIDGNNISSQLYRWHCTRNDCFAGDYDKYAKTVYDFFRLLSQCNITPLLVFDGSYEDKKLRTVYSRMRDRVSTIKRLNSLTQKNITAFPLFMRDLFMDIVLKLGLKTVRCDFEADSEMACLARSLNCPVLSYDSDFYVFDVLYIPFSTFEMSKCRVKNSSPTRYCIHCKLYRIDNFIKLYGGLEKSTLPLISILLGNDYIKKSVFQNFYSHIKLPRRRNMSSDQQRKIASVIKWMQGETYESAVRKILGRLKTEDRKSVAEQIKLITEGYTDTNSKLLQYLDMTEVVKNTCDCTMSFDTILKYVDLEPEDQEDRGNCSDTSESDSESSRCSSISFEASQEMCIDSIPNWFMDKYRKCEYPPSFMDILLRNTYFCIPQLEDYSNTCSHNISINIVSAIHKILSSASVENLKYIARSENASIRSYATPPCDLELPALASLKDISSEEAKCILFKVLEIDAENVIEFIDSLPDSWHLYVLAVIYWIKKAKPKVAYCHVYSIVLCALVLNKVDTEVGYYRSSVVFLRKYERRLNALLESRQSSSKSCESVGDFTDLLNCIDSDDCLQCFKELITYFQMDIKMSRNSKLFDIHIIDCFAQFQSCLLHTKYLNMLLNKPFGNCCISEFYDGTFLYNMCSTLMKRNDVDVYLSTLLKNGPSILNCFKAIVDLLVKIMSGDIAVTATTKRRRRRKKNTAATDPSPESLCREEESEEEALMDMNNRFSLLRLAT